MMDPTEPTADADSDTDTEPASGFDTAVDTPSDDDAPAGDARTRTVPVPLRLYKTVTVFSTLFAILGVVLGFVLLDRATDRARADLVDIDPLVAVLGLGLIVAAAVVYAFSTRFRVAEMGKPKDPSDEESDNG